MKQETREYIKKHIHSAVITFLSVFLPLLAINLDQLSFDKLEGAGFWGAVMVIGRLVIKLAYEAVRIAIVRKYKK